VIDGRWTPVARRKAGPASGNLDHTIGFDDVDRMGSGLAS
jgi:hypothetical protein